MAEMKHFKWMNSKRW